MKNGVECYKDFFPYFKALKTNCVFSIGSVYGIQKFGRISLSAPAASNSKLKP